MKRPSAEERFWPKVKKTRGCWNWVGSRNEHGYGNFSYRGKQGKAHRFSFELVTGLILTTEQHVCHHCDNPSCVRPEHLFLGDRFTNMQDMSRKGRSGPQKKTHCKHRHLLSGDNLQITIHKGVRRRRCVKCQQAASRRCWLKKKAELDRILEE